MPHLTPQPELIDANKSIDITDAMMIVAQAVQQYAQKAGILIDIHHIYNDTHAESLALISGLIRDLAQRTSLHLININAK